MIHSPDIKGVRDRLEALKKRIPEAVKSALTPAEYYLPELMRLARETLTQLMPPEEETAMETMLGTIKAMGLDNGALFTMRGISVSGMGVPDEAYGQNLQSYIARTDIVDWVKNYKELKQGRGERDRRFAGEGDDDYYQRIADNVLAAINMNPTPWFNVGEDGKGALNPEGLVRIAGIVELPPERVAMLLVAVMDAWSSYLHLVIPENVLSYIFTPKAA